MNFFMKTSLKRKKIVIIILLIVFLFLLVICGICESRKIRPIDKITSKSSKAPNLSLNSNYFTPLVTRSPPNIDDADINTILEEEEIQTNPKYEDDPTHFFRQIFDFNFHFVNDDFKARIPKKFFYSPEPIKFPQYKIDFENAKLLEDYLKSSYSSQDYCFKVAQNEEKIKKYLDSIEIPEEFKQEVISLDFKYRLNPQAKIASFINRDTWIKIVENTKDDFLKKILLKINVIELKRMPDDCEEKEMSKFLLKYKKVTELYSFEKINENSFFLDLSEVEAYQSEIESFIENSLDHNYFERKFFPYFIFYLCEDRIKQIIDYFKNYGLIIPEELVDSITGKLIKNPVLFHHKDDEFFDITTLQNIKWKNRKLHPAKKTEIELYENLTEDEKIVYDDKIKKQKEKIEKFLDKLGSRFRKFYEKYSDENKSKYELRWHVRSLW